MAKLPAARGPLKVAAVLAVEAAAYVVVRMLGVGGYINGTALAVGVVLVVGGGLATFLTRTIDDGADRGIWIAAAAVVAVTIGIQAASVAPLSKGRLQADLDGLTLPFFETRSTHDGGHSWCRPTCPVVRRVYAAPPTSAGDAMGTVLAELRRSRIIPRHAALPSLLPARHAHFRTDALDIDIRVAQPAAPSDGPIRRITVEIRLASRRR